VPTLAVTAYEIGLWLHISAVVVGFGATFAESVAFPVAMNLDKRHLPYVHAIQLAINRWLAAPATVVILLTGLYMVGDSDAWDFSDAWIGVTFAILVILAGLNGAYFIPTDRRLMTMVTRELEAGGNLSEEYQRRARAEGVMGAVAGVLVIAAIFLMTTKPGA
jgi:uncharacterized membrane protein